MSKNRYNEGETHILFIPPSWLIAGTVAGTNPEDSTVILKDAVYLENVNSGFSMIGDVPAAQSPKQLTEVVSRAWPIPDGMTIRTDAVLISVPCAKDMKPLHRQRDAETIRKTK